MVICVPIELGCADRQTWKCSSALAPGVTLNLKSTGADRELHAVLERVEAELERRDAGSKPYR